MKVLLFVIGLSFASSVAYAQLHQPTWFLMDDRAMSSFDMLTTRKGLIGVDDNRVRILSKYDSGIISGIFPVSGTITSIIIIDENVAYFTVNGDGIYETSNLWTGFTRIIPHPNAELFAIYGKGILANLGAKLYFSDDGSTLNPAAGILGDSITAAEFLSSQIALAVCGNKIYRSHDGGRNWNVAIDTLSRANSIYFDRAHSLLYVGGGSLLKSPDSGKSWQTPTSTFFILAGPVIGANDCSGNFYLAPDILTHGPLYRSIDQGKFFQEAGPAIFSSIALKKGKTLDRGSTFFWLDQSGLIGVVRDGIDSTLTDSVGDHVIIQPDSGIRNSLCNSGSTQFNISVSFDQCTGVILDSLKQVGKKPSFIATFDPGFLGDRVARQIPFAFRAGHAGFDTAHYRLRFHSQITGNVEQRFFDVIGLGIAGVPDIALSSSELDFPITGLDSIHSLNVQVINSGCDSLEIDSMLSTNPAIFIPDAKKYPFRIAPGLSFQEKISFNPHLPGDYLESMEIVTNIGNRFLALRGTGKSAQNLIAQSSFESNDIRIFPNPANNSCIISSSHPLPKKISLADESGKEVLQLMTNEEKSCRCDLHQLTAGTYFLDPGNGKYERIVVQR